LGSLFKPAGGCGCRFEAWSVLSVSKAERRGVHFFLVKGEPASVSLLGRIKTSRNFQVALVLLSARGGTVE
jgi:hypothetical protein